MKIYVMRHGQTVWNAKGFIQGHSQNRLSKTGKAQVEETAQKLKNENIDLIISSPLMRTMQTANIMNQYHGVKIIKNEKIIENHQGIFTGRKKSDLTQKELELKIKMSKEAKMETMEEVVSRTKNFIEELKQKYSDKSVLVVTHNIVASAIEGLAKYNNFDKEIFVNKITFDNAELKKIEI